MSMSKIISDAANGADKSTTQNDATNDNANENKVFDSDKDSNDATASTEAAERLHSDPLSSSSPRIFIHSVISSSIPVALIFVTAIL